MFVLDNGIVYKTTASPSCIDYFWGGLSACGGATAGTEKQQR